MAIKVWLLAPLLFAAGGVFADGQETRSQDREVCKERAESLGRCHWINGTISIYNGTPSVRIRQHGSKHMYAVGPSENEWMPSDLKAKLTIDNAIDAKLKICPFRAQNQRGLRVVCIDEAKILKISENPYAKTDGPQ